MKSLLNNLLKFLAFVTTFVFVISVPLLLLVFNIGRVLFNGPLVKEIITDIVVESDLLPAALAWFSETSAEEHNERNASAVWVTEPDVVDLIDFMDIDDWRRIKQEVLTREILAGFVSTMVDETYVWIDSDSRVPQVAFDLDAFIQRVNTEHGVRSIEIAYQALPPCVSEQVKDFETRLAAAPAGTEVLYNLCQFPQPYYEDQFSDYLNSLSDVVDEIPPDLNLTQAVRTMEERSGVGPEALKTQLRNIRTWWIWAPFVVLGLLVLILAFGVRGWIGLGRWWGVPMVLGGLGALILTLVYRFLVTTVMGFGAMSEMPTILLAEAEKAILAFASAIFSPMMYQSLGMIVLGILLLVMAAVLGKRQKQEVEPEIQSISPR